MNVIKIETAVRLKISLKDVCECNKIAEATFREMGDSGTCVMGEGLYINNMKFVEQVCQGCLTNERIFKRVREYLEPKYPGMDFRVDYGVMD